MPSFVIIVVVILGIVIFIFSLFEGTQSLRIVMVGKKAPCCVWFLWATPITKKKRKKGGDGSMSVELHYTITTISKLCQTSPSNLLGSRSWEVCKTQGKPKIM
jgi:hypothetical protein